MKLIVVLYHANCPDGFGAAWAAWKKFGNKAEYITTEPRTLPKEKLEDADIFVLDNSFSTEVQEMLRKNNKSVVIIDHHESSEQDVKIFPENIFDIKHSGAVLAWKYFHPQKEIPLFLKYVEDVDLWKFKLPYVHQISSFISANQLDFTVWNKLARDIQDAASRKNIVKIGSYIEQYKDGAVNEILKKARVVRFGGYDTLAVNSSIGRLVSELGNRMCIKMPPIAIVWHMSGDELIVSLRSDGTVDVSKLAAKFGGGGHNASSGFVMPTEKGFPWKSI